MHKVDITTRDGVKHSFNSAFVHYPSESGGVGMSIDMSNAPKDVDFSPENIQSIETEKFDYTIYRGVEGS